MSRFNVSTSIASAVALLSGGSALAGDIPADARVTMETREAVGSASLEPTIDHCVEGAVAVLETSFATGDPTIPHTLLREARAILVVPHAQSVARGAGQGLVSWRDTEGRWSAPAFVTMNGPIASFASAQGSVDVLLVITDPGTLDALAGEGGLHLAAKAGTSVGPTGNEVDPAALDATIYTYCRTEGHLVGASLEGVTLGLDNVAAETVYGEETPGRKLLETRQDGNAIVDPWLVALDTYVPDLDS